MAQSPVTTSATTTTTNQNGFSRKMNEMNNNLSSSPRRTAIGKPSLRLSIPTIEQIAESKNHTDPVQKKSGSFVKRMIDNCNHSGQLPSNVDTNIICDNQSSGQNAAEICDPNRVRSVIEKLDKTKRISGVNDSNINGKSPTDTSIAMMATDVDKKIRKLSIDSILNEDKHGHHMNDNNDQINSDTNGCSQIDSFPSYSKFENDFKKRINELNSNRLDVKEHGS